MLAGQTPQPSVPPPTEVAAAASGGNSCPNILKLGYSTRYLDPTRVVMPVFLLCLPQQIPKKWVIKVNHRHQIPMRVVLFLPHVYSQVPFRYWFSLNRVLTHPNVPGLGKTEPLSSVLQRTTPFAELGHGFARRVRWV